MKNQAPSFCAYCLADAPKTRDHIPPKCLFTKPLPSNLITVPCCEECRRKQSLDDEYFRLAVVSSFNCSEHSEAQMVNQSVLRSLRKLNKARFAQFVNKSLFEAHVETPAGLRLGRAGGLKLKAKRIDAVAERIIRGLFFHELGRPVPKNYEVTNVMSQFGLGEASRVLGHLNFPPPRVIGRDAFCYTFVATKEDPNSTIWLQLFYGGLTLMGFTTDPARERVI